eukprot:8891626-Ditylum_brightwellii.AAC.1
MKAQRDTRSQSEPSVLIIKAHHNAAVNEVINVFLLVRSSARSVAISAISHQVKGQKDPPK